MKNFLKSHASLSQIGNHQSVSHHQQSNSTIHSREQYWNNFYANNRKVNLQPPSQFAAFVASEYSHLPLFIDIGCGNGRDTLFFAQLSHDTIGIDASTSAISLCQNSIPIDRNDNHIFIARDVSDLSEDKELINHIQMKKKLIYSRFFLHAIDELEELYFFDFAFACTQENDVIAIEFRTHLDKSAPKITEAHYRRYIDPDKLIASVTSHYPAQIEYFASGTGMAKYKQDDAHVARIIFKRASS